jgi:methionine synthase I (cobalamin-dependent)/5,10-methylenetetrahydrofolate reductase
MQLRSYLKHHKIIPDGSMGTYYSQLVNNADDVSEYGDLKSPQTIEQIHKEYIAAGARIIRTNTFAANTTVLSINQEKLCTLVRAACKIAKNAVKETKGLLQEEEKVWIFGDIGPIPERAQINEEEVLQQYCLLCDIFMDEGLDGIHFETFSSMKYIEKLVPYIRAKNKELFILVSFSLNKNGYTMSGISGSRIMEQAGLAEGIDACGFNCGVGSGHMLQNLKKITFPQNKFLYAAPNAGYPEQFQNRMVFMDNPRYFAENMKQITELGIDIAGGCCGTTPQYIQKLVEKIDTENPAIHDAKPQHSGRDQNVMVKTNEFYQKLMSGKKVVAVELDPPYDSNTDKIMECAHKLKAKGADLITFADSPMGRSRVDSVLMGVKVAQETGMHVMPHLCCRDRNIISMRSTLLGAYIHGIRNLLIVTGDPVPGESRLSTTGVFDYNSIQLMEYVKEMNVELFSEDPFYYGAALNQALGTIDRKAERMQRKINAGAKYFLTQPIYSKEDVARIKALKSMVDTKILSGIMPLTSYTNACFIKNEMRGIDVPDEIVHRFHPDMPREEAENEGAAIAREMMELLAPVADGYYLILSFNRVSFIDKILK